MKIADIMIAVKPVLAMATIDQAVTILATENLDILPVVDDRGKFIGALTYKELNSALRRNHSFSQDIETCIDREIPRLFPHDALDRISADSVPAVVLDEKGDTLGVITARSLASLITTNRELEAIIDYSYDGIWVMDGDGQILRVNKAGEKVAGRPAESYVGKNVREFIEQGWVDQSPVLLVMEKKEQVTVIQTVNTAISNMALLTTATPIFDDKGRLFRVVANARDISELIQLRDQLSREKEISSRYMNELLHLRILQGKERDLIFRSAAMQRIVELASRIADVDSTVLITGESGTGKEMIARLIHRLGRGNNKPFITINCGAIPEQLLESELFGYEQGAFTGAKKEGKPGMFELAHRGTLFLDEVGELPLPLQVKLLNALQNKEITRIGGTKPITVDVRIITATNKDLALMLKDKTFRADLYYRLMVVPINVPSLRERKEDIPALVHHFVAEFNGHFGFKKTVSPSVIDLLVNYDWHGNVRELKNIVERMMVMSRENEVTPNDLPGFIHQKRSTPKAGTQLKDALEETEKLLLMETHKVHKSWRKVADILGIDYSTVYRKVARYNLLKR